MTRSLVIVAIAILMSAAPALAADDAQTPPPCGSDYVHWTNNKVSRPARTRRRSSDSSAGTSSDTSTGAKDQFSASGRAWLSPLPKFAALQSARAAGVPFDPVLPSGRACSAARTRTLKRSHRFLLQHRE